jgi:hypothetical protein
MLPGMTALGGLIGTISNVTSGGILGLTDFFTTTGAGGSAEIISIPLRPGYSKMRVTCIGPGGASGYYPYQNPDTGDYTYNTNGGFGGNCSIGIVTLQPSSILTANFNGLQAYLNIGDTVQVLASTGSIGIGSDLGEIKFAGGAGQYQSGPVAGFAQGGGAAGNKGAANGATPGACTVWINSADNRTATASGPSNDFGGGANSLSGTAGNRGRGLVVLEWGITTSN